MIMLPKLGMIDPPATRHAEVEDHRIVAVGMDQPVFRAPSKAGDFCTSQPLAEVLGKGSAQVRSTRFDARDPSTLQHPLKPADGRFNFGKLRHCGDMADGCQAR